MDTANSLHSLAVTQHQLGDYHSALQSETEALDLRRKLLGDHVDTEKSLDSLGVTQFELGALQSITEAQDLCRKLLGEDFDTGDLQ